MPSLNHSVVQHAMERNNAAISIVAKFENVSEMA
jgi:hypothetical protein